MSTEIPPEFRKEMKRNCRQCGRRLVWNAEFEEAICSRYERPDHGPPIEVVKHLLWCASVDDLPAEETEAIG